MNSVRSDVLGLKSQRFTLSGCKYKIKNFISGQWLNSFPCLIARNIFYKVDKDLREWQCYIFISLLLDKYYSNKNNNNNNSISKTNCTLVDKLELNSISFRPSLNIIVTSSKISSSPLYSKYSQDWREENLFWFLSRSIYSSAVRYSAVSVTSTGFWKI